MKKKTKVTAGNNRPIFAIFASVQEVTSVDKKALAAPMQVFTCASCSENWALNPQVANVDGEEKKIEPFCPNCGSDESELVQDPQGSVENLSEAATLASVLCEGCDTTLILASAQKTLKGVIACPNCNTISTFADAEEVPKQEEPQDVVPVEAADEDDSSNADPAADPDAEVDPNAEEVEASDDDDSDEEDEEDADEDDDTSDAGDVEASDQVENPQDAVPDNEDEDSEEVKAEKAPEYEGKAHDEGVSREELPVLSFVQDTGAIEFFRVGDKVLAAVNDITVAYQSKAHLVEARHELFDSPTYMKALGTSTRSLGLARTLEDFGFKKLTLSGVNKEIAKASSEKRIQTVANNIASEKTEVMAKELNNCLGIASVALNKGFYSGRGNPTKEALASELRNAGVRNPERMIDKAFASTADRYSSELLTLAWELLKTPVEARNQIAASVRDMSYRSGFHMASDDDEAEDGEIGDSDPTVVESNLSRPFLASNKSQVEASVGIEPKSKKGSALTTVAKVLESRGGRLF
jgi:hypothetical protein